MSATTSSQVVSSIDTLWMGNIDTTFMNEDFIKNAFAQSGYPDVSKVQIKPREQQGKLAGPSYAFVTFSSESNAQKAMDDLNEKPIPNCGDSKKTFKLNFMKKSFSQAGFNSFASRSGLTHDAGRHSGSRSSPAWHSNSGKPNNVPSNSVTAHFANKPHGHSQQTPVHQPPSQQQLPHQQPQQQQQQQQQQQHQQQQQQQQPQQQQPQQSQQNQQQQQHQQQPKQTNHQQQAPFSRASSRSYTGRQPSRNQQNDYWTIFVGNLDCNVASETLQETFKSIYSSVSHAKVIVKDGESKQFGFVHFLSEHDFKEALNTSSESVWSKLRANLGKDTRISKAHPPSDRKNDRRRISGHPFTGGNTGTSAPVAVANGSGNVVVPAPSPSDSNLQDINSNSSNLPNSSPSSVSNLSNHSNNNPTPRPSSNSASPAKPTVQPLIPHAVIHQGYAYPHQFYYYPNTQFASAEAFAAANAGQIPQFIQPAGYEGHPLYWQPHYPPSVEPFVPRGGPVHPAHPGNPAAGDVIHPTYGHAHTGQNWSHFPIPAHFHHPTLLPSDSSDIPPTPDQMHTFDSSRA